MGMAWKGSECWLDISECCGRLACCCRVRGQRMASRDCADSRRSSEVSSTVAAVAGEEEVGYVRRDVAGPGR